MPRNKGFSQRIELLDECLRRKQKKWFIEDLLEVINEKLQDRYGQAVSKRTIQYDLDYLLNEKQAPVEKAKDGARVYYFYSDPNYSILNLPVSEEELSYLRDAIRMLRQVNDFKILDDVDQIVDKLEQTVTTNVGDSRSMIQFEKHTHADGSEYLDDLFTAIRERSVLKISYEPFGQPVQEWVMHPYLLKEYRNRWFLIGRKDDNTVITNLALDRIRRLKNSSLSYSDNDRFDPETYFDHIIGVSFPEGEQVQDVVIKVHGRQAFYVRTKPVHHSQQIESTSADQMLIKLRLINNYELRSVLLSYGPDIEVVAPESLKDQMKALYTTAAKLY